MDLGLETLRETLKDLLGNSGGRRGREREQRREERLEEELEGADADASADEDGASEEESVVEESEPEPTFTAPDSPDRADLNDDEAVDDLFYRVETIEEELETNSSQLGAVRDSQENVADKVEEVNDTVRQLLGIYDQLTDDVNPFTGQGEEEGGFGIFGEEESATASSAEAESGFDLEANADEESVSFDDLKGMIEDAAEAQAAEDRESEDGERIAFDEEGEDDTSVEVQATESVDGPDDADEEDEPDEEGEDVTLESLADTYATDVLIFEWLTDLVRTAGPAATLRAISYYAEIGWIDEEVQDHLEGVLSGPDLDIHVEPESVPDELTAEDHADSYTYIMKLQEIHETRREVEA